MTIVIRAVYVASLSASLLWLTGCNPTRLPGLDRIASKEGERLERETREAISKSANLQEIHRLCTQEIPRPNDFVLMTQRKDGNGERFLSYGYRSSFSYHDVKRFYGEYFSQSGWNLSDQKDRGWGDPYIEFSRGEYKVKIYYFGARGDVNYAFHCAKLNASSDHYPGGTIRATTE